MPEPVVDGAMAEDGDAAGPPDARDDADDMGAGADPERRGRTPTLDADLEVRSSIERGQAPLPGPEPPPFFWHDVVHEPLPPQRVRGEGEVVLYHGMEVDPEVRITYTTRVVVYPEKRSAEGAGGAEKTSGDGGGETEKATAEGGAEEERGPAAASPGTTPSKATPSGDAADPAGGAGPGARYPAVHVMGHVGEHAAVHPVHRLLVDCRISVQKRVLLEAMDRARRRVDAFVKERRQRLTEHGAERSERIEEYRSPRLRRLAKGLLRSRAHVVLAVLGAFRDLVHAAVVVPDRLVGALLRAQSMLHTRLGRRTFWDSVKNPRMLTLEERGVMVFLVALVAGLTVLVLNSLFALVLSEHAPLYRRVLADTGIMVLGVLFLPILEEPLLVLSVLDVGPAAAFTGFMVGKMLAVWIMYLLGTTLHETVADRTEGHPRLARGVEWLQSNADRHGAGILFAGNALPFVAGVVLYPLALAGMRFRDWMGGIVAGTALRYGVIIAAVLLVGPGAVEAWLANPLG